MNIKTDRTEKKGVLYKMFKAYLRFFHDRVYYNKVYRINREAIPRNGTSLLIVSNHQNCLNDPLGLVFTINDRKPYVIARADVFKILPGANRFLRSIGLLPAYRLRYDGVTSLGSNVDTFRVCEEALIAGRTIIMYPEGAHQDGHWLGDFSLGYTRMAFEAAEMAGFEKDVQILPACNHYSNYFGLQNRVLVKFGEPISIQPYYDLYKSKPRTAQREVNRLVHEQISNLMLDVHDLDNYDAIDFIRVTYGEVYAKRRGINPDELPERLLSDKDLVKKLEAVKKMDEGAVDDLYRNSLILKQTIESLGITDGHLKGKTDVVKWGLKLLLLFVLFPLWLFSWWPSMFVYWIAMWVFKTQIKDRMFWGTIMYSSAVLFTIPLCGVVSLLVIGGAIGWFAAMIYVALFPVLMLFCWKYAMCAKRVWQDLKCLLKPTSVAAMKRMRKDLHKALDEMLNI